MGSFLWVHGMDNEQSGGFLDVPELSKLWAETFTYAGKGDQSALNASERKMLQRAEHKLGGERQQGDGRMV